MLHIPSRKISHPSINCTKQDNFTASLTCKLIHNWDKEQQMWTWESIKFPKAFKQPYRQYA